MPIENEITVKNLRRLLSYMHQRQTVYLKRQAGVPFPWTDDPILKKYRLENVYRENDKQTRWLAENWREPYRDHANLWFAICLFRMINWSPTLAEIGFPETWDPDRVLSVMKARRARGEKTYTSAYRINQRGEKVKAFRTVGILNTLWSAVAHGNRPVWETDNAVSLESAHSWLMQFPEWGGFLAYEAITDLRHTRYLEHATDIYSWANPGPGAARGICRLLGVDLKTNIPRQRQIGLMRTVFAWVNSHRDKAITATLEMRDAEHALCAFDKWERANECLRAGKRPSLELLRPPVARRYNLFGEPLETRKAKRPKRESGSGVKLV